MAYFVRVGVISENKSGVGARGYQLYRRGSSVITRWGGVEVTTKRSYFWAVTPQEKIYRCRTPELARLKCAELATRRVGEEKYQRLPSGAKIGRRPQ